MNITIKRVFEFNTPAKWIYLRVPLEDEQIKGDPLPGRSSDGKWDAYINIETGEWTPDYGQLRSPHGLTGKTAIYARIFDEGFYSFLDEDARSVHMIDGGPVPAFFPGDHYGQELILKIDGNQIVNWNSGLNPDTSYSVAVYE